MTWLALLLAACSVHPPSLDGCPRAVVAVYTASESCLLLESVNDTLFRLETSESCGGPERLCLRPGETGYALERRRPAPEAEWSASAVLCEACP